MFLDKNAPPIVAVEREIGDGIGDGEEGRHADEEGLEEEEDGDLEEVEREVLLLNQLLVIYQRH